MSKYRKTLITNQLKENLSMWLTARLLDNGYYRNISYGGPTDFASHDLSTCYIDVTNSAFASGQCWRAIRPNWVYEGDVSVPSGAPAPIVPSGVFVGGVFKHQNDSVYGHVFDYTNGRIIFTSGATPPSGTQINTSFSYKEFTMATPNNRDADALFNTFWQNDPYSADVPDFSNQATPICYIRVNDHKTKPLALGGGVIIGKNVSFHFVGNDANASMLADMGDLLSFRFDETLVLLDVDTIPERLNYRGEKSITYMDYKPMTSNLTYFLNKASILSIDLISLPSMRENLNQVRVDCLFEIRGITE